ncbi:uncharacterized protein BO72DRAFT_498541 [Aspergillus fijiensis CBS 313.89]|uniref:Uncharacterized protein n=1 Tax=Aspergillus fijiensis CBS 313.89 TaxID=1448319 RepID=A0A8G1RJD6_9EURO|nr:uncharacterized protein BO72DRAFT_498541 [Aspergillus fijiensis CBS 313.89]RAK75082.1 hypothetical protein BO72DRAFT_498541 [Aspergillus fijiensis CBS 313.89]
MFTSLEVIVLAEVKNWTNMQGVVSAPGPTAISFQLARAYLLLSLVSALSLASLDALWLSSSSSLALALWLWLLSSGYLVLSLWLWLTGSGLSGGTGCLAQAQAVRLLLRLFSSGSLALASLALASLALASLALASLALASLALACLRLSPQTWLLQAHLWLLLADL